MTPANITLKDLNNIKENTLLPDAFITAYNAIFDANISHINYVSLSEYTAMIINDIFNKWLVFVCHTCISSELQNADMLPKGITKQTIRRKILFTDIYDNSEIAQKMRRKLLKYDLHDFYIIFWMAFGEWGADRANLIKNAYKSKRTRQPRLNVIFTTPKSKDQTMKRALKSMFGISVVEVMASAIFLLLKEQMETVDASTKQEISTKINQIQEYVDLYIKHREDAKKSHKKRKNDSY